MKQRPLVLLLVLLISAGGTFVATYAWQAEPSVPRPVTATEPASGRLTTWLNVDPRGRDIVNDLELAYRAERRELEAAVAAAREELAALFDGGQAGDEEILAQVERVIAANNALERRTARFLLDVRPHLTRSQSRRLLRHFAEGVREAGRYRWRHGQQQQGGDREGVSGPPAGRGKGRGRGGPPWRNGQRP
jgi:Spy/CpxP family protein refolding chaperone